jgi:hypothetical protein
VPFEELVGGGHESPLADAFQATQRVGNIGPIGSGKSSLIEYVTTAGANDLAPIWISVGHEAGDMLRDPPEFARHLILEVLRWARDSRAMGDEQRRAILAETTPTLPTTTRTHRQDFSLKLALRWLDPAIGDEVEETVADPAVERARTDFIASLDRLVDLIREDLRRVPIVLIDDSDRWLRLDGRVRDALLEGSSWRIPHSSTRPPSTRSSPPMIFSRVDLPEPDRPVTATSSPAYRSRSSPSKTRSAARPSP